MKLFACMCNQPQRLAPRSRPCARCFVAQPPVSAGASLHAGRRRAARAHAQVERRSPSISPAPLAEIRDGLRDRAGDRDDDALRRHRQHAAVPLPALDVRADRPARISTARRRACSSTFPSTCAATSRAARPASSCSTCSSRCCTTKARSTIRTCRVAATRRALAATIKLVARRAGARPASRRGGSATSRVPNGRSMVVARLERAAAPAPAVGRRRRGERDESFRGVLLVSGGDGDPQRRLRGRAGAARGADHARPQVQLADLGA